MGKKNRPSSGPDKSRETSNSEAPLSQRSLLSTLRPWLFPAAVGIAVITANVASRIYHVKKEFIQEITHSCSDEQKMLLSRVDRFVLEHRDQIVRWTQDTCEKFAAHGYGNCDPLPEALFESYVNKSVKRYCPVSNTIGSRLSRSEDNDVAGFSAQEFLDESAIALYPLAFDSQNVRVEDAKDPETARVCHLLGVDIHERVHLIVGTRHVDDRGKTGNIDGADLTGLAAESVCIDVKNHGATSGLDEAARMRQANEEIMAMTARYR